MAVGLASAVGAFAQGAPVPPGEEAPGYDGGEEIETIIVIGNKIRCPGGRKVNRINQCPGFIQSWLNRINKLVWDPVTHVIRDTVENAPTCGATKVDASCVCGGGKVKAYDDGNDTFHCKPEPPVAGCPKWGQTFNFALDVWDCQDNSALDVMGKIKDCLPPGTFPANYWGHVSPRISWNNNLVNSDGEPVPGATYVPEDGGPIIIEFNYREIVAQAQAPGSELTEWEAGNVALIHEMLHVVDAVVHGPRLWRERGVENQMELAGYGDPPFNLEEYEDFTVWRTTDAIVNRGLKPDVACLAEWK